MEILSREFGLIIATVGIIILLVFWKTKHAHIGGVLNNIGLTINAISTKNNLFIIIVFLFWCFHFIHYFTLIYSQEELQKKLKEMENLMNS